MEKPRQAVEFPPEVYEQIGLDHLLIFAAKRILDNGEECTFERLVAECFTLFPKKFGMRRYPQWPDSVRVNKSWLRCRTDNGWLVGNVQKGFKLTSKGIEIANTVAMNLEKQRTVKAKNTIFPRGREDAIIRWIRTHPLFMRWISNREKFTMNAMELRNLLNAPMEAPITHLRETLHRYIDVARVLKDADVEAFLKRCQQEQILKRPMTGRRRERS
ncbi:MAG: hypothetical protein RMJ39_10505 [Deltaproteobacteria bacterium]|nr:hypothetical protein [Deltaproteobacteria bacterium]